MELFSALWIAAAILATILMHAGFSLANLKSFPRVMGILSTRPGLRPTKLQSAPIPPLLLTSPLPDPRLRKRASLDRFGGLEPDRLQGALLRKMIELEKMSDRDLPRG